MTQIGSPHDPDTLPLAAIGTRLARVTGDHGWRDVEATLIAGGRSNLTYLLTSAGRTAVLRRPPTAHRLESAHDMGREVRVQRALSATAVPVAQILDADLEGRLLDVPSYVMERVDGHVVRDRMPPGYATSPSDRAAIAHALVDTLALLHRIDPASVGLGDLGRPVGFAARQVRRWQRQWNDTPGPPAPELDRLAERLSDTVPVEAEASIVHGDYRLDNVVLDPDRPGRIRAVLDWELSTLGDPLTDVGMLLFHWRSPGETGSRLTPSISSGPGWPDRDHLARRYVEATGSSLHRLSWYLALAHLKYAAIVAGVAARVDAGGMGDQDFGDLHDEVRHWARRGLAAADSPTTPQPSDATEETESGL